MDSRLIYIANEKMKQLVKWPLLNDSEWLYFGAAGEVNKDIVLKNIESHFEEKELYVAWTRNNSFKCNKTEIFECLNPILGFENFVIWNKSFRAAIEFSKIGVLRCGKV